MIRPALRSILAVLGVILVVLGWPGPTQAGSGKSWKPSELNWHGISQRRVNDTRADADLAVLAADRYLWELAHERARDMLRRRYLAAVSPEGLDAGDYMREAGARYAAWTELRADDRSGAPLDRVSWQVIDGILNDAGGRQAVLGPFDRLGVGFADADGRRVFVILVARAEPPPPPEPTPPPAPPERPVPVTEPGSIAQIVVEAALRHGIDPDFFLKVAKCESNLNPRVVNPIGPYIGLFQFHRGTFASNGGRDIYDPYDQAEIAARMFAKGMAYRHWECARIVAGRRG